MKKDKIIMTIVIGLMCFILVYVMFLQFKVVEETDLTEIETMREDELREALAGWKTKYSETNLKLQETNTKLEEYTKKIESNEEASELLAKELEQTNKLIGKTDVTGDGVVVTLEDNQEQSIVAFDLLELIDELKLAGAEAISINNQRIINMTDIVDISNSFILVNSERVTSPYVVKAIGEPTYLDSALNLKNAGFVDKYKKTGKSVKLEKQNGITINKYMGEMNIKYIKN